MALNRGPDISVAMRACIITLRLFSKLEYVEIEAKDGALAAARDLVTFRPGE